MTDKKNTEALDYHEFPTRGKLCIQPTKPLSNQYDLALAYSPGVAEPCEEIVKDPLNAAKYTARGNLVGVVTNGSAVLGLGNIGALASKPVMEGKAVLFKKFANIDVFDIEVDESDVDKLVDVVAALEPTFGGINLEDIKAPECFFVEQKLKERMNIPVFHDDQHGTAICSAAAVYNGLRIVEKDIDKVKLVVSGSGAASIACVDLLISMGLKRSNVLMIDRKGVIYKGRKEGMNPWKESFANETEARTLDDAMHDADIFLGLSAPKMLTGDMCKKMARDPLILAMANPTPEIMPEEARTARPDAIIATGRSDYPNQVNNVLCFPFIFRGALDCGATTINEAMKEACVKAIADLAHKETSDKVAEAYQGESLKFGREYLIPKPFDPRLIEEVPVAVVKAAMESGVATRPIADLEAYAQSLKLFNHRSRIFMKPVIEIAKTFPTRIAYGEGENKDILRAVQVVVDEKVTSPILIGRPDEIRKKINDIGLRMQEGTDYEVVCPADADADGKYSELYHSLMGRHGVAPELAQTQVRTNSTILGALMRQRGEIDGLICGKVGRFDKHLSYLLPILAPDEIRENLTSVAAVLHESGPLFLTDPFVHVDPTVDQIVNSAEKAMDFARKFDIEPKVALLSHSDFGSYDDAGARKMKEASALLRARNPDAQIDGEMYSLTSQNEDFRSRMYAESPLTGSANILVMPNMDAASITLGLIRSLTKARMVGPSLVGLNKGTHILIPSVSPRGIYNMTALTVADIQYSQKK
jgi:malate dehydrogenase (oxaloacetate-decarboxylating)(NADP+)|tara:strand:- start:5983 stop:8259 length:2277 start_codon:yes stop_codon:yes gene_type:complete